MILIRLLCLLAGSAALAASPPLVVCVDSDPDGFDSALSDTAATHRAAAYPLYNRLVAYAPGTAALQPELAQSWASSADGLQWTFKLRRGVVFHRSAAFQASRPFNADDVLWSVQRQLDPKHPGAAAAPAGFPGAVAGNWSELIRAVVKLDDYTVRFDLTRPYAPLPALLASWPFSIVSAEYGERLAQRGQLAKLASEPIGTGPYQLLKYDKGAIIRYAAHPGYFKGPVAIGKLIFSIQADASVRVQKLRRGECQLADSLRPQDKAALAGDSRLAVRAYLPQITSFLAFNSQRKPFDDARIRRALSLAIDRAAIVRAVYEGQADTGLWPYSGKALWGVPSGAAPAPDLAQARRLLKEAGYPNGFDTQIWARVGGGASNVNPRLTAELVQADWAKLGVRAKVVAMESAELGRRGRLGEHDTIISGWMNSLDPDELYTNLLTCQAATTSTARWCDPAFDAEIAFAQAGSDRAARDKAYRSAAARFVTAAPWAVLAYPYAGLAHDKRLLGVQPSAAAPYQLERLRWP
ncbi:ABC transporter substrate-binding protein [Chitinimonas arctica]|uniref:ABC transporter substrate-binding protein n=1 Tax=Chitinimonas arctica TaxID=2594795 RepID=A0A516SIY9_9NEIS|nr:ABC transporter substrate-binding protein [Chitinimonas arctica]QDQ28103.1 ABC transporter substrate-binding protein [Chitinimonas arctica]